MQQDDLLLPWASLLENAMLPARVAGKAAGDCRDEALDLLQRMGLGAFAHFLPHQVSGGMRQRCALVRTVMFHRPLVLLDEPLSALDAITRRSLQSLLLLLQSDFAKTLLMITHDVEEALLLADELVVVSRRPMRILEKVSLPAPKPRRPTDPHLLAHKERILSRLEKELG